MQLCLLLLSFGKERGSPRLQHPVLGCTWESVVINWKDYVCPINQKVRCPVDQMSGLCTVGKLPEFKGRGLRSLQLSSSSLFLRGLRKRSCDYHRGQEAACYLNRESRSHFRSSHNRAKSAAWVLSVCYTVNLSVQSPLLCH